MASLPSIIDITLTVHPGMAIWPGDPPPRLFSIASLDNGDTTNTTAFSGCLHLGTHVDAPLHLFPEGRDISGIPLSQFIGPALVKEIHHSGPIGLEDLQGLVAGQVKKLLLKTPNSLRWQQNAGQFFSDYAHLTPAAARQLVEMGFHLIGIDALSVDAFSDAQLPVHKILLSHDVVIVEGLNLSQVPEGTYGLICLPLKVAKADGAPARALLLTDPTQICP